MKRFYAVGYKGEIQSLVDTRREAASYRKQTPVLEIVPAENNSFPTFNISFTKPEEEKTALLDHLQTLYLRHGRFGPYGDVIQISRFPNGSAHAYAIDFIARRAYHKPGLAADLVLFVRSKSSEPFFVGIRRKKDPGKDGAALIGGFIDVDGFNLETAAVTVMREAGEEIGLKLSPFDEADPGLTSPNACELWVRAELANAPHGPRITVNKLTLIGTFNTSDEEKMPELGLKRIYRTTAYALVLNIDANLTEQKLASYFEARDDAENVDVYSLRASERTLRFGFRHHQEIFDTARIILNL